MRGVTGVDATICIATTTLRTVQRPFTYGFHQMAATIPGLYAFWLNRRCLYVGESLNLSVRLYQHRMHEHNSRLQRYFDAYPQEIRVSFAVLPNLTHADLLTLEREAIRRLRPLTNVA